MLMSVDRLRYGVNLKTAAQQTPTRVGRPSLFDADELSVNRLTSLQPCGYSAAIPGSNTVILTDDDGRIQLISRYTPAPTAGNGSIPHGLPPSFASTPRLSARRRA